MSQKKKDTYYNKNLLDAQNEFEEKKHNRKQEIQKSDNSVTHPPDKGNASKPPDRNFRFQKDEEYTQGSQSNKISGNYYNRNLQEAQKDYQETFHRKNGQLSGSPASNNYLTGSPVPENQIGKMQIGTKAPTSVGSKAARVERLILKTGGKFAATTATSGSDAGAGLQFSAELSMVAIGTIANNAKITMSNGMNSIMNTRLSELGESLLSAQGNGTLKCPDPLSARLFLYLIFLRQKKK